MADISLSSFKAALQDACRPNRFLLNFTGNFPAGLFTETMQYAVKGAQVPGQTVGEVILNWQGMQTKVAGDPIYDDFTVTFINDYDMSARKFIEDWIKQTKIDPETNIRTAPEDYRGNIIVQQLGRGNVDDVIAEWELIDAHPKVIDQIELSMDQNDTPSEFSVTFAYDYWIRRK